MTTVARRQRGDASLAPLLPSSTSPSGAATPSRRRTEHAPSRATREKAPRNPMVRIAVISVVCAGLAVSGVFLYSALLVGVLGS